MTPEKWHMGQPPEIAPVDTVFQSPDVVSHSLAVLATVYHYNHWIFNSVRDHLGSSVLEVGAGMGNITQFLLNVENLTCLEPFDTYRQYLADRFKKHLNVAIVPFQIEDCPNDKVAEGSFDSVVCLNVLEHIEDDVAALVRFRRLLRPGGKAVVLVPALPWIYGAMDEQMGHFRRYTLGSLRRAFRAAGLRPVYGRYMNLIGAFGWWWRARVRRKTNIPEKETRLFDRMVPMLSAIEQIFPPLIGQSVIVVGTNA